MRYATAASRADLKHRMAHHPPTETTIPIHEKIRKTFLQVALALDDLLPPSREKSLALTHLEDSMMSANAAIARHLSSTPPDK